MSIKSPTNVLSKIGNRYEFRDWLIKNAKLETECWLKLKRGRPVFSDIFYYIDVVEQALCFGWIDSTKKLNVSFYKNRDRKMYKKALSHLSEMTKIKKMFGKWNDYGRLLNY